MAYHPPAGSRYVDRRIFNTYGPKMKATRRSRDPDLPPPGPQDRPITVFGDGAQTRVLLLRRG